MKAELAETIKSDVNYLSQAMSRNKLGWGHEVLYCIRFLHDAGDSGKRV